MFRKFFTILLILMVISAFSLNAFAGKIEGGISAENGFVAGVVENVPAESGFVAGVVENDGSTEAAPSVKDAAPAKTKFEVALENALRNGKATDNGQFVMVITSPDKGKDSTYKKSYVLSGKSESDDVVIAIARYNESAGEYEPMKNTVGYSTWVCSSGIFSEEILLNKGVNKIKILSYRISQKDEMNWQVNCFTIELLDESIANRVIRKGTEIGAGIGEGVSAGFKSILELLGGKSR